jgi:hypothetical protein
MSYFTFTTMSLARDSTRRGCAMKRGSQRRNINSKNLNLGSSGNGYFHLVYSVTQMAYLPGAVTGTLLYLPLGLLAARHAVRNDDIDGPRLLAAFARGTIASFLPFIHVWIAHALRHR